MIHLYPLEEHPHFCSFYWGGFNGSTLAAATAGSTSDFITPASINYDGTLRSGLYEDPRIENLRKISYGVALPIICALGIVGNVLNLVVLTRRNMRGTAYIYMRGYSAAALLAIIFAIPFGMRMLIHRDSGRWRNFGTAFYHAHLELFLGNGCLGVGVIMLLVLTIERYVSVCHPGHIRRICPPRVTVVLIPVLTFLIYLPSVLRGEIVKCVLQSDGTIMYHKRDNMKFLDSLFYSIYKVILEIVFKLAPTVLIAGFNLRIMIVYRRTCDKRRRMTLSRINTKDEDPRKFAEERRLMMLLALPSPCQPDGADQLLADVLHLLPVQRGLPEHALPDDPVALVREAALQPRNRVPPEAPRVRIDPERPPAPPPPIEREAPTRERFLPGQRLPPAPLLEPAQSAPVAGFRLWWHHRPPPPPAPAPSDGHSDDDDDDGHGQQHAPTSAPPASHVDGCDHDDDHDHLRRIVVRVLYRGFEHQRAIVEHLTH